MATEIKLQKKRITIIKYFPEGLTEAEVQKAFQKDCTKVQDFEFSKPELNKVEQERLSKHLDQQILT